MAKAIKAIPWDRSKPALIIAFGSPKGGPGKTTLAVAVAAELSRRIEGPVCLADFDLTANAFKHLRRGAVETDGIRVGSMHLSSLIGDARALVGQIRELATNNQVVILDTPGAIENPGAQTALTTADLVILPVTLSIYDYEATLQGLDILRPVAARNPDQKQMVVINKPERTTIDREIGEALAGKLQELGGASLAKTVIRKSVGHKESAATGRPVWALGASGKVATTDVANFTGEILAALGY